MNKIVNINLGGYPIVIDEDAYSSLDKYLKSIKRHFSKSEGFEDIVFDIEHRMAELLKEKLKSDQIVTQNHIDQIIAIMGRPESFSDDTIGTEDYSTSDSETRTRKLFRNPEDKFLGGVCSGVAAYFGIENVFIARGIFLFFFLMFGTGLLIYLFLWIFVPEAKTSADFLSMRGEPITANNIAKTVEKEISELKDKITDLGNEFKNFTIL